MRHFQITNFFVAIMLCTSVAVPANAQNARKVNPAQARRLTFDNRAACDRSFADARCANYQNRLLKAVVIKAVTSSKPISNTEIGNRQIDALISTIN